MEIHLSKRVVLFLIDKKRVLLGKKKKGFGQGKYVGIGGKIEKGETAKEAVIREVKEEIGVELEKENIEEVGVLRFIFPKKPSWSQEVVCFVTKRWQKAPKESEEIKPVWVEKDKIPFDKMWDDAKYWLPFVLNEKKLQGTFVYEKGKVVEYCIKYIHNDQKNCNKKLVVQSKKGR